MLLEMPGARSDHLTVVLKGLRAPGGDDQRSRGSTYAVDVDRRPWPIRPADIG